MKKFAEDWLVDNQHLLNKPLEDFMKNRIIISLVLSLISFILFIFTKTTLFLIATPAVFVLVYSYPIYALKGQKKQLEAEVMRAFPDWVATLQTLVLIHTIPNAIKESVDTAPLVIREDIQKLSDKVMRDPINREHYLSFLSEYENPNILEVMLSLYQFNFAKKENLAFEFEILHARMDRIASENRRARVNEKKLFYGMVLMAGPGIATFWILFVSLHLSNIVMDTL